MNFYTRKTKLEDFTKKDEGYILGADENTFPKFAKKYPYTASHLPRWSSHNKMVNRLGKFEALMRKYDVSSPKNMEEKLIRSEELEKKETPMKAVMDEYGFCCPSCGNYVKTSNYCGNCGQKLEWLVKNFVVGASKDE